MGIRGKINWLLGQRAMEAAAADRRPAPPTPIGSLRDRPMEDVAADLRRELARRGIDPGA